MGWAAGSPGGSTAAAASGRRAWLLDEEARCWIGGREESDGRGRRQALIKNEQRAVEKDGHHPACREVEGHTIKWQTGATAC